MKRFGQYILLLVIIGSTAYFIYQKTLSPCDKPLEYSVGRFDLQFGLSEEEFKKYVFESEKVWEKALDKDAFIYNPSADFKINLIYDERQLATIQKQKTEFGLSAVEDIFKKLDSDFNIFKNEYERRISLYEQALASYDSRKSAYDKEVSNWNKKGGAPKEKFEALNLEREYLNAEAERLSREAVSINKLTLQFNTLLTERNLKASEYNKVAENYNRKYNGGLEFNQAEYIGNHYTQEGEINVYQFGNKKDLVLALTHEFGHALGLNHVENPKSVMYYITGVNVTNLPTLSAEDLTELKRVCDM